MNQLLGTPETTHQNSITFSPSVIILAVILVAATMPGDARADITLPKFFSDHMVLQQNADFPVWGTAEPNQALVVRFNDAEVKAEANAEGRFSASIKTPSAGGPYRLEIADEENSTGVILDDVMVGEVWLCAGQSNMSWPVEKSADAAAEVLSANNYNQIRLFTVEVQAANEPTEDVAKATPWSICSADNIKDFSAVAYFFGRELAKTLKETPIGLIDASSDGTSCEAWCSMESLEEVAELEPLLKYWSEIEGPNDRHRPGALFNGIISPLVRYPLRGVIWYQGEANVGRGKQYATLLPTLIADWRKQFGDEQLPFYLAQLTPYRYSDFPSDALPEVWDAQLKTAQSVTNVALATTMDLGSTDDLHPKNKQTVGKRLALLALSGTYQGAPATEAVNGPLFDSMSVSDDVVRIKFQNVGAGLKNLSDCDPIGAFVVCGEDRGFHPARVEEIGDDWVTIVSPEVQSPTAVRYCWDDTAASLLGNSDGLPAFPFRTDDYPLSSEDAQY
jgi:sialate O-acetylesterase